MFNLGSNLEIPIFIQSPQPFHTSKRLLRTHAWAFVTCPQHWFLEIQLNFFLYSGFLLFLPRHVHVSTPDTFCPSEHTGSSCPQLYRVAPIRPVQLPSASGSLNVCRDTFPTGQSVFVLRFLWRPRIVALPATQTHFITCLWSDLGSLPEWRVCDCSAQMRLETSRLWE